MDGSIEYLERQDINISKWNQCINTSANGLCYADAFFLDSMSTNWHGLIMGDYEAVMPLPFRKKYGISYLYQPAFTQQLGIIHSGLTDLSDIFLRHIPSSFKYWDITLNFLNRPQEMSFTLRKNYLLNLNKEFRYSRTAKRNIRQAVDKGVVIEENVPPETVVDLHVKRFGKTDGIEMLTTYLKKADIYTVAAKCGGEYLASSLYIRYKNRLTFILNGNLPQSLKLGATHLIKDHVVKKFLGSDYILDFEGSETPSFARFYEQFGAKEIEYYPAIINNKLPSLLKLFK